MGCAAIHYVGAHGSRRLNAGDATLITATSAPRPRSCEQTPGLVFGAACEHGDMIETVAVLADIHGVLPVLDAVLAEPDIQAAERIVVCGDHAAGPQPVPVLDRLTSLDNVVLVRGNADRDLVAMARGEYPAGEEAYPVDAWAAAQLAPEHVALLAGLPHPVILGVRGFGPVAFCHGTPRDDNEVVLVDTRLDRWAEAFAGLPADVQTVVCGHTHM